LKKLLILLLITSFSSCQKDNPPIDDRLQPYFDKFIIEASQRGKILGLDNLSGSIVEIGGNSIVAQCTQFENNPDEIKVDKTYWSSASESQKEFYIFHELGHCLLNRDHLNATDKNGNCISIMHGTSGACKFLYNESTRSSYLDELFQ
jgi:hypothetical protein